MDAPLAEQQKFSKQLTKLDFLARKMDKLGLSEEYISDRHPAQIKSLPYWINYLLRRNLQAQNADQILSRALSGELSQADAKKQLLQGVQNSQEPLQDLAAITLAVDKLEELVKQSQAIANGTETEISAAQFYRKINRWQPFHPNLGHDLNELKNYVIDPGLGEQLVFSYKLSSIYCPSETRTTFLQLKEDLQKQGIDLIAWLQTLQKVSVVTFENILADPQKLQGFADFLIEAQQIDQQRELFSKPSLFLSRGMKAYCFLYDFDKYLNFETSRFEDLLTGKTDLRDYVSFLDKLYRSSYQIQRLNLVGPRIQQLPGPFVRRRIVTKLEDSIFGKEILKLIKGHTNFYEKLLDSNGDDLEQVLDCYKLAKQYQEEMLADGSITEAELEEIADLDLGYRFLYLSNKYWERGKPGPYDKLFWEVFFKVIAGMEVYMTAGPTRRGYMKMIRENKDASDYFDYIDRAYRAGEKTISFKEFTKLRGNQPEEEAPA